MGIPAFVAASAKAAAAQDATPALPAGMSANAIVLLVAVCPTANTLSISANGSISSWNLLSGMPVNVAAGEALYVWWGRWSSGSTGPTVHASASNIVCAGTVAYSGCIDVGSPIDISATGTETTSDTSFSFATGISSTRNNCMAICVASILRDSNVSSVPVMANASLASLTSRMDFCTNTGSGGGFGLSEGTKATAGTLGTWSNTYGAASPKGYVTFALIGGTSGVVTATNLSVSDTVTGSASKTGTVSPTNLTVSDTVSGFATRKAIVSPTNLSISDVVAGSVSKVGSAALNLTISDVVAGFANRKAVVSPTNLSVSDVVAGFGTHFAIVSPTNLSISDVVAGARQVFGVATPTALSISDVVSGVRSTFGVSATNLSISDVISGLVTHFATVTPTGIVVTDVVSGGRTTFGIVTPTSLSVADVIAGLITRFGIVSPTNLTVSQFVGTGSGGSQVFGTVNPTNLSITDVVAGIRETFSDLNLALVVTQSVIGWRVTFGQTALVEVVDQNWNVNPYTPNPAHTASLARFNPTVTLSNLSRRTSNLPSVGSRRTIDLVPLDSDTDITALSRREVDLE